MASTMGTGRGANPLPAQMQPLSLCPTWHRAVSGRPSAPSSPLTGCSQGGEELWEQGAGELHRHTSCWGGKGKVAGVRSRGRIRPSLYPVGPIHAGTEASVLPLKGIADFLSWTANQGSKSELIASKVTSDSSSCLSLSNRSSVLPRDN